MPQSKRSRTLGQQNADVLYGPVDAEGNSRTIAKAAMELVSGLHPLDVFSAQYAPGQPGIISIRFKSHDAADRFIESMEAEPLIEGQAAIPVHTGPSPGPNIGAISRQPSGLSPRDIIHGVGKNQRHR